MSVSGELTVLCKSSHIGYTCTGDGQRLIGRLRVVSSLGDSARGFSEIKSFMSWSRIREDLKQSIEEAFRSFGLVTCSGLVCRARMKKIGG